MNDLVHATRFLLGMVSSANLLEAGVSTTSVSRLPVLEDPHPVGPVRRCASTHRPEGSEFRGHAALKSRPSPHALGAPSESGRQSLGSVVMPPWPTVEARFGWFPIWVCLTLGRSPSVRGASVLVMTVPLNFRSVLGMSGVGADMVGVAVSVENPIGDNIA